MEVGQAVRPAYQQLAEDLRDRIVSGQLRPGDRLPTEPQLSATSGLSRSTVREALRLLASQHLITTTRGVTGGSFVAQPTTAALADTLSTGLQMLLTCGPVDGWQVFEVRELLEVPAAVLAATRATPADLRTLHSTLVDQAGGDLGILLAANRTFHTALAAASGNPLLELIAKPLYTVANERTFAQHAPPGFWERVDADHRRIMAAIVRREPDAAGAAAAAHLNHLRCAYPAMQAAAAEGPGARASGASASIVAAEPEPG